MQIKARTTIIPILALSFLALGAMPQGGDPVAQLTQRVQALEAKVQAMQGTMDAQSKAAKELIISIDEAEKAGFTAGINPRSREILLNAWRAQARAMSSANTGKDGKADGAKPKTEPAKTPQ
ncbi:MAG: hypothetical protein H6830_10030 [Planctomycetes bacterium]|nr:hypothetical protein [Planctomycetota bacterium]MCB9909452.1 hypothetical protein [Planctomycetota bacterium]HPF13014.1 hypothetical protein [Planctomycetota bacterium]HRV81992.1 hypothetical protein [Planctomycetota bacterium]